MTRDEKITKILRLSGVPEIDFDITRPNLQKLTEADLDDRLVELAERAKRMAEWRATRGGVYDLRETRAMMGHWWSRDEDDY